MKIKKVKAIEHMPITLGESDYYGKFDENFYPELPLVEVTESGQKIVYVGASQVEEFDRLWEKGKTQNRTDILEVYLWDEIVREPRKRERREK